MTPAKGVRIKNAGRLARAMSGGTPNTRRDQGQVVLHSNRILNSVQYGIVVEDGLRDLPEYRFFDSADVTKHAQFTHGDYVPQPGAVRNLSEVNQDALVPGVTISNNTLVIQMPTNAWVHVAVNVDRVNALVEIYFDGVSQGTVPLLSTSGASIYPTQDLQIGVINGGSNAGGAQQSGLDDLAFYDGLLSAADVTGLASGALSPLNFLPGPGTQFCPGDGIYAPCPCGNDNDGSMSGCDWSGAASGTAGGELRATGSGVWLDNDTYLVATNVNADFGVFFAAPLTLQGNLLGDGLRCIGAGGGTPMIRLTPQTNPGGSVATHALPLQTLDWGAASGVTRHYQYWFRAPGSTCGSGSNTTNGYTIQWM